MPRLKRSSITPIPLERGPSSRQSWRRARLLSIGGLLVLALLGTWYLRRWPVHAGANAAGSMDSAETAGHETASVVPVESVATGVNPAGATEKEEAAATPSTVFFSPPVETAPAPEPVEPAPPAAAQPVEADPLPSAGATEPSANEASAPVIAASEASPVSPSQSSSSAAPQQEIAESFRPRAPRDVFEAQIALTRDATCPGPIDGIMGSQTRNALVAFQRKHGLRVTGELDAVTREQLRLLEPPLTTYAVTEADLACLRPSPKGWLERAQLDRLDFSSVLELVAEKHWAHTKQIERLNPGVDWERITAGTIVSVPFVRRAQPRTRPDRIVIHLTDKTLQLFDAESRLLAHFPCSIARRVEKRPVGRLEVVTTAPNPNYTFNPDNFPDSPEAQAIGRRLILQPGPNNPVGVAWIGLNLSGYGIHGSPEPEKIGRTESAGCFRLSNWNAEYLLPLVYPGMTVQVEL